MRRWYIPLWLLVGIVSAYMLDWNDACVGTRLFTVFLWPIMWLINILFMILLLFVD